MGGWWYGASGCITIGCRESPALRVRLVIELPARREARLAVARSRGTPHRTQLAEWGAMPGTREEQQVVVSDAVNPDVDSQQNDLAKSYEPLRGHPVTIAAH